MRRASKIDANQIDIVEALRSVGCRVQSLAAVGSGVPDLLVGCRGRLLLVECKDGSKPPSARALTPDQVAWHEAWAGYPVWVISSVDEALALSCGRDTFAACASHPQTLSPEAMK